MTIIVTVRHPSSILAPLIAVLLVGAMLPGGVVADHGGREIGSVLACNRPVTPPRCTSVGDDRRHYVVFDESLTPELAAAMRVAMAGAYGGTKLNVIEQRRRSPNTDVVAYSADYGDNGAAAWVYCPSEAPQGVNHAGDRWCRQQELIFNLNPRYGLFFDDDGSRQHVACHELGHTVGLRHWGNPPETSGPVGATCMNANTPNGPTGLHPTDVDHINEYAYRADRPVSPPPVVRSPAEGHTLTASIGGEGLVGASEVERPTSLGALTSTADLVVLGRVSSVDPGRTFGPEHHPLQYATVTVEVDEVLAGDAPLLGGGTVLLELPLLDGPDRVGALEADLLGSRRVLFLRNKATSAMQAGADLAGEALAEERRFHRLVTFGSEIVERDGLAQVPPDEMGILDHLTGGRFADAVRAVRDAAAGR